MLTLESSALIGRGLRRECYFHPEDENKCIKVVVSGDHKETRREQSYYRLLEKRNISWRMLARFYGNVDTNLGEGAVFDLIRDYNGEISKTLGHYFSAINETDRIEPIFRPCTACVKTIPAEMENCDHVPQTSKYCL